MNLTPKNWASFQHYTDRSPAWIKLHRRLLDDFAFSRLPVASRALAPLLWLLASEYEGGKITCSLDELAFRLRMTPGEVAEALNPLLEGGFFQSDSIPLAERKQEASLEKRRETRIEEKEKRARKRALPDDFERDLEAPTKAGLSNSEGDREWEKFKNHAKQNGRTCVDWQSAWRNWCLKAAEFMGRAPPQSTQSADLPGFYAPFGSPQLEAWDKTKVGGYPRDKAGGWRFPTEWPPGKEEAA
jgi:hypothetical protein